MSLPHVIHAYGTRYVPAAAAESIQVKVVRWKRTDYSEEFWQELIRRVARKIIGATPVKLKLDFKFFKSTKQYGAEDAGARPTGTMSPFPINGWWEITVDPKNLWHMSRTLAHSVAHEITHVAQHLRHAPATPAGISWAKDPLEIEANRLAEVGGEVFDQLLREGWQTESSKLRPLHTIIKAPPGVSPEDWALIDKPLGELTPDELQRVLEVQRLRKLHRAAHVLATATTLTRDEVTTVLAAQPGNRDRTPDYLADKWVVSDHFTLLEVHAQLPDLGVTAGKSGESVTAGPIIVERNVNQVARPGGAFGAPPDFLVLDGQNRVVSARRRGPRTRISAYVGNAILADLQRKDAEFAQAYEHLQAAIDDFLSTPAMPGGKLSKLKSYVERGLLTPAELEGIRQQWRTRHKSGEAVGTAPCRRYRRDRVPQWTPALVTSGCQSGCPALDVAARAPCPFDGRWATAARQCPCYR